MFLLGFSYLSTIRIYDKNTIRARMTGVGYQYEMTDFLNYVVSYRRWVEIKVDIGRTLNTLYVDGTRI